MGIVEEFGGSLSSSWLSCDNRLEDARTGEGGWVGRWVHKEMTVYEERLVTDERPESSYVSFDRVDDPWPCEFFVSGFFFLKMMSSSFVCG